MVIFSISLEIESPNLHPRLSPKVVTKGDALGASGGADAGRSGALTWGSPVPPATWSNQESDHAPAGSTLPRNSNQAGNVATCASISQLWQGDKWPAQADDRSSNALISWAAGGSMTGLSML